MKDRLGKLFPNQKKYTKTISQRSEKGKKRSEEYKIDMGGSTSKLKGASKKYIYKISNTTEPEFSSERTKLNTNNSKRLMPKDVPEK